MKNFKNLAKLRDFFKIFAKKHILAAIRPQSGHFGPIAAFKPLSG
jgi:hypothetical protein